MKFDFRGHQPRMAALLVASGLFVASCETASTPEPVYVAPTVSLPTRVLQAAAVYEDYVAKAAAISPEFTDGPSVSDRLRIGAAYEAEQIQRGEAAYAAIAALQDPTFVAGVRAYASDPATRSQIVAELLKDPAYAIGIKGSNSAAALAAYALDAQGARVLAAGQKVKQAAYDVQKQAWSKAPVADRMGRMAEAKALSLSPRTASPEALSRLRMASSGQAPMPLMGDTILTTPPPPGTPLSGGLTGATVTPATVTPASTATAVPPTLAPPYTPLVVRGLAVAALAVLGEGSEANSDNIWAVLNEPNQGMCFNMAKLNLYQCLSVAKPYYEDVFCLGQHIMMDTGQCIVKGAGVQTIAPLAFVEPATAVAYEAPKPPAAAKKRSSKKK